MSKSVSGLFNSTSGAKEHYFETATASDIISARVSAAKLDTNAHPLKYKQLSSKQKAMLSAKIHNRTISKADYKLFNSNSRLARRRTDAINRFWEEERVRVSIGLPTRKWTNAQIEAILSGQRPKHNGKTIQGHHTYPVNHYPHLANRTEVIYPSTYREHLYGWHGGNFKKYKPGKKIKNIIDF